MHLLRIERTRVTKAGELLKGLAEAEAAEDAGDQERSKGDSRRHRQLWIASVLISLACLVAVVGISVSVRTAPTTPDPADTVVTTQDEVTRYLAAHVPAPVRGAEPPVFIPTGLYIQSVEFTGPYTLEVSGQIWQRYANDLSKDINQRRIPARRRRTADAQRGVPRAAGRRRSDSLEFSRVAARTVRLQ